MEVSRGIRRQRSNAHIRNLFFSLLARSYTPRVSAFSFSFSRGERAATTTTTLSLFRIFSVAEKAEEEEQEEQQEEENRSRRKKWK